MLSPAIAYLNSLLAATGYLQQINGVAVLIKKDGKQFPAYYCGSGEHKRVTDFDGTQGMSYWRLRADITDAEVTINTQVDTLARRTYPLRLVVAVMREHLGNQDNEYSEDRLSMAIMKTLKDREKALRQDLGANNAQLIFRGVITNPDTMAAAELISIPVELRSRALFIGIELDLIVDYKTACIQDFCSDDINNPIITYTATTDTITVTFSAADADVTVRKLYRSIAYNGPYGLIANVAAAVNSYEDSEINPFETYFYKLVDSNSAGTAVSNILVAVVALGEVAVPFAVINSIGTLIAEDQTASPYTLSDETYFANASGGNTATIDLPPLTGIDKQINIRSTSGANTLSITSFTSVDDNVIEVRVSAPPITITNDKATPQTLITTGSDAELGMTAELHYDGAVVPGTVAIPPPGTPFKTKLLDINEDPINVNILFGPGQTRYDPATDSQLIYFDDVLVRDEDDADINASFRPNSLFALSVYDSAGTDKQTITAIEALSADHVKVEINEAVTIGLADFSQSANYTAFLGNATAKASPWRMPPSLFGSSLWTGDIDYLVANGRFGATSINPVGRTKAKKLSGFLTLHADNPRPDASLDRFQNGQMLLGAITVDFIIDWLQEYFYIPSNQLLLSVAANNATQYAEMITFHSALRFPRRSEVELLQNHATGRVHGHTGSNTIKTLEINKNSSANSYRYPENMITPIQTYPWNGIGSFGAAQVGCYLEEIPECGITP